MEQQVLLVMYDIEVKVDKPRRSPRDTTGEAQHAQCVQGSARAGSVEV